MISGRRFASITFTRPGIFLRDIQKSFPHSGMERTAFGLDAVVDVGGVGIPLVHPLVAGIDVDVQNECQIRPAAAQRKRMQILDEAEVQLAGIALIGRR